MLTIHPLTPDSPHLSATESLYGRAFPINEQRDFADMLNDPSGICDLVAIEENGAFIGFACTLNCIGIAHIIYFAIEEPLRGRGLGSEVLRLLHLHYAPQRVIVDIEQCGDYPDNENRLSRKNFYLRAGYRENPVTYRWQEEDYEVLSYGGSITREEFSAFWREAYSKNPLIG